MGLARASGRLAAVGVLAALAAGCAFFDRSGRDGFTQVGIASWYDPGRRRVQGRLYDSDDLTAAHRTLPYGTRLRITNLENGRRVVVVVNDRGPFVRGRVVDISRSAAARLGIVRRGLARVRVEVLGRPPSA